jgi:outer membrane protein
MSNRWMPNCYAALAMLMLTQDVFAQSLDALIAQARQKNHALQASRADAAAALAALDLARAERLPRTVFSVRGSRNEGGREITIPVADALNPVYSTLNRLTAGSTQPTQFPNIDNPSFRPLRDREYDARISTTAALYAPGLAANVLRAKAELDGAEALRLLAERTLIRDVQLAYFRMGQARAGRQVLEASQGVLAENVRVNEALLQAGSITRDKLLRAEVEVLAVQDRIQSARDAENEARRYLNFLRAEPLDRVISGELRHEFPNRAAANLDFPTDAQRAAAFRSEAARAQLLQAKALAKPLLGLGLDAGTQGETLGFGRGQNFASIGVNLSWTLFDFGASRSRVRQAQAALERRAAEQAELDTAVALRVRDAKESLASAILQTQTALARQQAAVESFRIADKQRSAGSLRQIEYLDAERASTEAQLAVLSAQFAQAIARAELELATSAYPLSASTNHLSSAFGE